MGELRFEVLGPLRAWRDSEPVNLGPLQQRVVLAVLLLHANRPFGRDQMIDAVWGPAAPTYAVNLLQKHVSGLRRALEPGRPGREPSQLLAWTDAGYQLNVPAEALDLSRFDRAVDRARVARRGRRPGRGRRGHAHRTRPVAGTGGRRADQPAARRRAGPAGRAAGGGGGGRRSRSTSPWAATPTWWPSCGQLVADHPLRERLSRPAHAGAVPHRTAGRGAGRVPQGPRPAQRRAGRRSVGAAAAAAPADPGRGPGAGRPGTGAARGTPARRGARHPGRAHVRAQSAPTAPGGAAPLPTPPRPAQLPRRLSHFVGRIAEIDWLGAIAAEGEQTDAADAAVVIAAITGTAGVGKTTLAVHWAHRVGDRFPDGQLYVNLRGFDPAGPAMEPGRGGARRSSTRSACRRSRSRSASRRRPRSTAACSPAGGCWSCWTTPRDADQVRPLLPGSAGCLVVVTSRNQLTGLVAAEGAHPLTLDLLTAAEARPAAGRRLGADRVAAEPAAVDGHHRAVRRGCRWRWPSWPPGPPPSPTSRWPLSPPSCGSAGAAWTRSTPTTGPPTCGPSSPGRTSDSARPPARLFRLLGAASRARTSRRPPRPAWPACRCRGRARLLAELARAHLVTERDAGPVRASTTCCARTPPSRRRPSTPTAERRAALHRLLDHYLHTAHAGRPAALPAPGPDHAGARPRPG